MGARSGYPAVPTTQRSCGYAVIAVASLVFDPHGRFGGWFVERRSEDEDDPAT